MARAAQALWPGAAPLEAAAAVLRRAAVALGLTLDRAAMPHAVVAVGIVASAALAGRWAPLARATRVLPRGVATGLAVLLALWVRAWPLAVPLLLVGALGDAMVVPLNAQLQHRGHQLPTAEHSIAMRKFNEKLSMLVMLGVFAGLLALNADVARVMVGLGLLVAVLAGLLWRRERRRGCGAPFVV